MKTFTVQEAVPVEHYAHDSIKEIVRKGVTWKLFKEMKDYVIANNLTEFTCTLGTMREHKGVISRQLLITVNE